MRILYVHGSRGYLGDAIRVRKVYSFLKKRGFQVHEKWINAEKHKAFLLALTGLRYTFLDRKKLNRIRSKYPLEVLTSSFFSSIQRRILKYAMTVRPQVIVAETSLAGYFSLMSKKNMNIPLITDVHGLIGKESEVKRSRYAQILSNMEKIAFNESDYLLTVSQQMKRHICLVHKVRANKVFVIPNGGDVLPFRARFRLPLNVIYAGNFAVYERISDYLEIAKKVKQNSLFVFFLMGDGIQKRAILSKIDKEKIPITFLGLRMRQEALRIFSEMQVGVVPSTSGVERKVAFPIKVLDYMSCGLPVVAPKIGDWGEMIDKKNCGVAIKENSTTEFVTALQTLCNKEEWRKKSRNGKKCIEKEYSWNLVLESLGHLVEKIAA